MINILLFLSDFQLDNILWVVFLFNRGVPFLFIAFLEFLFYSFYAITKYLIFFQQTPSKIFLIISPILMLAAYIFIYLMNSYLLLILAFFLLAFSYYSYHDNLIARIPKPKKDESKEKKKVYHYEPIIFLSMILSNYFGGLFANLSWKIFVISVITVKTIIVPVSIIAFRYFSYSEKEFKKEKHEIKTGSFVKVIKNSKVLKLFISKVLILSIFEFAYIFVAFRLRTIFISPYQIGLLYSTEVIATIISFKYFYHFEALVGSYVGKVLTGIAFFSLSTLLFRNSFAPIALGFLFMSMAKNLNESLSTMNILNSMRISDVPTYTSKEDFFVYLTGSLLMFVLALIYTIFGSAAALYSILSFSLLYFALLIF